MMNRLNFNIKDRKVLTLGLCLILVCVFTLTIAYAALNAVLTISGNAQVTSSNWDIHLANPKVTSGSASTIVPEIKTSSSLEFSTTLNMPGDFYEFTVDVVNDGTIDAMIGSVVKNPELTAEQAKYLIYEITYQNGEVITTKQNLAAGATTTIKVRLAYRTDLNAGDLPTTNQEFSNMKLELNYVQSDGTGTDVVDNGKSPITLITFTIDGIVYQAEEGMTWKEWINSEYDAPNNLLVSVTKCANGIDECEYVWVDEISDYYSNRLYYRIDPQESDSVIVSGYAYTKGMND